MENDAASNDDVDTVGIMDAGAQYGKLIDRRIRQLCVRTEIINLDTPVSELQRRNYKALIISGGPGSLLDETKLLCDRGILNMGIPLLGICYGMQLVVSLYGGKIQRLSNRQDGQTDIDIVRHDSPLFKGIDSPLKVLLTHSDGWISDKSLGNLDILAVSHADRQLVVAVGDEGRRVFGVQFHPETQLTNKGTEIFRNFLFSIANCEQAFTMESRLSHCLELVRVHRDQRALVLLSGGVDSAVCAALVAQAIGADRVHCLHIDNGFARKGECEQVCRTLPELIYGRSDAKQFLFIDASDTFRNARSGRGLSLVECTDPEEKREIIGNTFVKIVREKMDEIFGHYDNGLLVQGTLRPDLIESASHLASSSACCIKTHHNDTELVREMRSRGLVLEPLKDFHKDEVREIARALKFPRCLTERHPFPGPGLAIRILCSDPVDPCRCDAEYEKANATLLELMGLGKCPRLNETERKDVAEFISKYEPEYAVLPIRTVGVSGDCRTYQFLVAVHCPVMDIRNSEFWKDLAKLARLILKGVLYVSRVLYSFNSTKGLTVRERCRLTKETVDLLRECDQVANKAFGACLSKVSQMPVILLPLSYELSSRQRPAFAVVLRPVITDDFMTAMAALPCEHLEPCTVDRCVGLLQAMVQAVMYDLTNKPPGTTEWE